MSVLLVDCPECGEVLELSAEDRASLQVGDVIACDSCGTEMEVTANEGEEFELAELDSFTTCPNCGEEFEVPQEVFASDEAVVQCPHCRALIELEFEDA